MFKLLELEFIGHPFLGSLAINFVKEGEEQAEFYSTLIIGPNGSGKSQVMLAVISIFNSLKGLSIGNKYKLEFQYKLRYISDSQTYYIEYIDRELIINGVNGGLNSHKLKLPETLIISAFSFNDKYPLRESRGQVTYENYHYLGLKSTTNNIFINNPSKIAISNLQRAILKGREIAPLQEAFLTLNLEPEIKLTYKPGKNFKFLQSESFWNNAKLSVPQFVANFSRFIKKRKYSTDEVENRRLGDAKIYSIFETDRKVQDIIDYLNENIRQITDLKDKEISLQPFLDLREVSGYEKFANHVKVFQLLNDLEVVRFERFEIKKSNSNFSFDNASSGEYHIILTFLNILSVIEENSLVLIDEPEISLHPNWQIKYMNIFSKMFKNFPKTHFVIASHSHFLVSDLKVENSTILAIELTEKGIININPLEKNTFGWSAEEILYIIFKVKTTRNYFIESDLTDLLGLISVQSKDRQRITRLLSNISSLETTENDPLNAVVEEVQQYLTTI